MYCGDLCDFLRDGDCTMIEAAFPMTFLPCLYYSMPLPSGTLFNDLTSKNVLTGLVFGTLDAYPYSHSQLIIILSSSIHDQACIS
jgi:hypothetical protein